MNTIEYQNEYKCDIFHDKLEELVQRNDKVGSSRTIHRFC